MGYRARCVKPLPCSSAVLHIENLAEIGRKYRPIYRFLTGSIPTRSTNLFFSIRTLSRAALRRGHSRADVPHNESVPLSHRGAQFALVPCDRGIGLPINTNGAQW